MSSPREFDIVLWGPTGFTGRLCVDHLAEVYGPPRQTKNSSAQDERGGLHYALAGRSKERLQEVADLMKKKFNASEREVNIPLLIVNAMDKEAVGGMCSRTNCVVALAGPYAPIGEGVVEACVEKGTHYVDITGEAEWVTKMKSKYDEKAKASGAKIVHCTGFDFVPNDLSMAFLHKMCESRNLSIQKVVQYEDVDGAGFSGGTLRSILNMLASKSFHELRDFSRNPYSMCTERPSDPAVIQANQDQSFISYSSYLKKWTHPSIMGRGMTRYVRWSNEVQGFPWGRDLIFGVSAVGSSFFTALFFTICLHISMLALFILSKVSFLHGFILPPSGKGSFDPRKSEGRKVEFTTVAHCLDKTNRSTKVVACNFLMKNAEPYKFTAISCIESALGTLFAPQDAGVRRGGVMSATAALGVYLKERMEKHGLSLTFSSNVTE